ncbi:hypothetical protein [Gluconobacter roseus]|uniref:hypothetical protein n=1 Tax=Gluconobacter roseus TaxID=586239 RepID=UPI0038D0A970
MSFNIAKQMGHLVGQCSCPSLVSTMECRLYPCAPGNLVQVVKLQQALGHVFDLIRIGQFPNGIFINELKMR